jgi:hypothetical protein
MAHENEGTLDRYDLEDLLSDIQCQNLAASQLSQVMGTLKDALRRGAIVARGRPRREPQSPDLNAMMVPIPARMFAHPGVAVTLGGRLEANPFAPASDVACYDGPIFDDVCFDRLAVFAVWPGLGITPAQPVEHLPAWWSLTACVAWIMLRDLAVMRDALPGAPAQRQCWDEHRDGSYVQGSAQALGRPQYSVSVLVQEWRHRQEAAHANPDFETACSELIIRLRAGLVHAMTTGGVPPGPSIWHPSAVQPREVFPFEWHDLSLARSADDAVEVVRKSRSTAAYRSVLLDSKTILEQWPANEEPPLQAAQKRGRGAPQKGKDEIIEEYFRRIERGELPSYNEQTNKTEIGEILLAWYIKSFPRQKSPELKTVLSNIRKAELKRRESPK